MKRIVNIYNFVRAVEPRNPAITPDVLRETTARQIRLLKEHRLPATFALQYDALIDPRYPELLRRELHDGCEVGAWWEIVQPLVEKAGLAWRGRYPWDWHAHVGFSPGYTPREREKLIDVYMRDFKAIFGAYPLTVGSWFIDAHSLRYLSETYGIVASCNCKDQAGTDGYTLWGGYWSQGYYPSRKNAYIPAQAAKEQIPVPVFRMLGSDPIYQYDNGLGTACQSVVSLEPVYGCSGSSPDWVRWFFRSLTEEPGLSFAYAQAGQENSFTWNAMAKGFTFQLAHMAELAAAGTIVVETLAQTGKWFRSTFAVTPATVTAATRDWKGEDRKTVWYNSRFYRMNLLWEPAGFRVRDIHLFDQDYADPYLEEPLRASACRYDALPVVDGFHWSRTGELAGIRPVKADDAGECALDVGPPRILAEADSELRVSCPVQPRGALDIRCREGQAVFRFTAMPTPGRYALSLTWRRECETPFVGVEDGALLCSHRGFPYRVTCRHGRFEYRNRPRGGSPGAPCENSILIVPDDDTVLLDFTQPGK